jgi:hypothetical protein
MTYTLGRDICEEMFGNMDRPSYIYYVIKLKNMKLELTPEQLKTVEIALNELFNSDRWIANRKEDEIDKIAERAGYLLNIIQLHNAMNSSKPKRLFTLNENR